MCGILGLVGEGCAAAFRPEAFDAALDELRERGPDGRGVLRWDDAWLGHRRLSIIDLEGGVQPMVSADGRSALTYNGEVFNFAELAGRLDGAKLRTRSDTEVVLELVRREGKAALRHLRGMFAFGHYDRSARTLLLARDPLGIKPLYWARVGRFLAFGSELGALRRLTGLAEVRRDALVSYLRYSYVPEPDTVFRGIHALEPAHLLTFDGREVRVEEYWRPRLHASAATSAREAVEEVEAATRLATTSDVPVASLLSGGIDSAVIAAVLGPSVTYYNLAFGGAYDETERARHTSQVLGLDTVYERASMEALGRGEAAALLGKVGQPFGDTSLFACHRVFARVAERSKVCISGDGGDEVFAGYSMRKTIALDAASRPLLRAGRPGRAAVRAAVLRLLRGYLHRTRLPDELVEPRVLALHDDRYWRDIVAEVDAALAETDDLVNVVSWVLLRKNLPNDMLVKVDRSSMLHSLEVRVPFLDHVVVEKGLALPGAAKQTLRETKRPLKRFLRERGLGDELLRARKLGFGPPAESWAGPLGGGEDPGELLGSVLTREGRRAVGRSVFGKLGALFEAHVLGGRPCPP